VEFGDVNGIWGCIWNLEMYMEFGDVYGICGCVWNLGMYLEFLSVCNLGLNV